MVWSIFSVQILTRAPTDLNAGNLIDDKPGVNRTYRLKITIVCWKHSKSQEQKSSKNKFINTIFDSKVHRDFTYF